MSVDFTELKKIFEFITEVEKLKTITRRIRVPHTNRYETVAEHSWQVTLLAVLMLTRATKINQAKVLKMLVIHDIVEIDAGDKHLYSANYSNHEAELECAKRLSMILPTNIGKDFLELWIEFEGNKSREALFAQGIDRLVPVIQNIVYSGDLSWKENKTKFVQIIEKNKKISQLGDDVWSYVVKQLENMKDSGIIG